MTNINTTEEIVASFTVADFLKENVRVSATVTTDPIKDLMVMLADSIENDFSRINLIRTNAFEALRQSEYAVRKLNECINREFMKDPTETKIDNYAELANVMNTAAPHVNEERRNGRTFEEIRDFWERSAQEAVNLLRVCIFLHDRLASQFENGKTFWQEHAARESYKRDAKLAQEEYRKARAPQVSPEDRKRILLDRLNRFNK